MFCRTLFPVGTSSDKCAKEFLQDIVRDSADYTEKADERQFKEYAHQQNPRATILTCCDSRIQMNKIDKAAEGDLFLIRNIGNQATLEGSIDYGVRYLHTPVLVVLGHSDCGAIKTALGNNRGLSESVRKEVETLQLDKDGDLNTNIIKNVHYQVDILLNRYQDKVQDRTLVIVGAVYDFANAYRRGYGKLLFININGEKQIDQMRHHPYFKDTAAHFLSLEDQVSEGEEENSKTSSGWGEGSGTILRDCV
jgi:carbonic anhydrase